MSSAAIAESTTTQSKLESPICQLIADDNKNSFHQTLRTNNLKIREIFYGTECNGLNLLSYAIEKDAQTVSKYIINRLPKHTLEKVVSVLESEQALAHLADRKLSNWHNEQI